MAREPSSPPRFRHGDRLVDGIGPVRRVVVRRRSQSSAKRQSRNRPVARQPEPPSPGVFATRPRVGWRAGWAAGDPRAQRTRRPSVSSPGGCGHGHEDHLVAPSPSSCDAFEVQMVSRGARRREPAALRASRRESSGNRIRAGSIAERGWCSSLNPPPDGDGVAGGRLRGRRGRRESRQERDLATLEKARGDARRVGRGVGGLEAHHSGFGTAAAHTSRSARTGSVLATRTSVIAAPRSGDSAPRVVVYPRVREDGGSLPRGQGSRELEAPPSPVAVRARGDAGRHGGASASPRAGVRLRRRRRARGGDGAGSAPGVLPRIRARVREGQGAVVGPGHRRVRLAVRRRRDGSRTPRRERRTRGREGGADQARAPRVPPRGGGDDRHRRDDRGTITIRRVDAPTLAVRLGGRVRRERRRRSRRRPRRPPPHPPRRLRHAPRRTRRPTPRRGAGREQRTRRSTTTDGAATLAVLSPTSARASPPPAPDGRARPSRRTRWHCARALRALHSPLSPEPGCPLTPRAARRFC